MQKKVLTEVDLYYGEIKTPKGYEIDRNKIKNDILNSFSTEQRISNNPQAYKFDDYIVPFSQPLQWLQDYMRDHWRADYDYTLVSKSMHGNVMRPDEKSWTRNQVEPVDLFHSPDYTFVYSLDVGEKSSDIIIEYDDNRRKNRTWHLPLVNNHFVMFPSTNKYCFTANSSKQLNTILTINYEYI